MENDLTIMFSGGLDSVIAYHYAIKKGYNPICLFVDMGQENSKKELSSIKSLQNKYDCYPKVEILNFNNLVPLIQSRLSNQIIPSRNVLLATIGSMFSPRVWINALDGEQNGKEHDKSKKFFTDITKLLSFTNEFFQKETIIETPFAYMTKSETIRWALDNNISKDMLIETTSCYNSETLKCGKCLTCYKRYVAFLLNNVYDTGYDTNPLESDYAKEMDNEIPKAFINKDYSRFTPKRINEYFKLKDVISGLNNIFNN